MKKLLMIALAALPFFANAQDKGTVAATSAPKPNENKFAIENPEVIFVELISSTNSAGAQVIKADFGREILSALSDKELAKQLTELRSTTFPSMPDAMNYLASMGYKLQQNYVVTDKDGKTETHFVYEKRLPRKPADGAQGKPRPERPTGDKPATDVKPADKAPAAKPADRKK